jgi:hypothetical protein
MTWRALSISPYPKDEPHGDALYNLPAMFALIARSKGVAVEAGEDTLGGWGLEAIAPRHVVRRIAALVFLVR